MYYIPHIMSDRMEVWVRADGRYAECDFTTGPQLYFEGTYYLPYVRKQPTRDFATDPYRLAWYDLVKDDFVEESGSIVGHLGRLRKPLVEDLIVMRKDLQKKIVDLEVSHQFSALEMRELIYAKEGMLFASVILDCAPQPYNLTLLTLRGFQRYFLEALACYEYLTVYRDQPYIESNPDDPMDPISPHHIMGCFTSHLDLAEKFYRKGVPVWLVRTPADISRDMIIIGCRPTSELKLERRCMAYSQPVFKGHASALRNRACQSLKLGNIVLSHSAYVPPIGDFNAQYIPGTHIFHFLFSRTH